MSKHRIFFSVCLSIVCQAFLFSVSYAQTTQVIKGTINPDLSATLDWSLPIDTNSFSSLDVTMPSNVGYMGIDYTLQSAYDAFGPIQPTKKSGFTYNLAFNHVMAGIQGIHTVSHVLPAFVTPAFIGYDLTPMTDADFLPSTTFTLSYPSTLQPIDSHPEYTSTNPLEIAYPDDANAGLIELNFLRSPLPAGYVSENQGIFTIVAKKADADRLSKLVAPLTFVPAAFKRILGTFDLDHVYIVVGSFSGKGNFLGELGAFRRSNKVIAFDSSNFEPDGADDTMLREMIIHEMAHSVIYRNTYHAEEKYAPWFDEGMAVFISHELGEKYLNDTDYFVAPDASGKLEVYQDLYQRFSEPVLLARYLRHEFDYDEPSSDSAIDDFYTHAGLVFEHFYAVVGDSGMNTFMQRLDQLHSCGDLTMCDTDKILAIMSSISGETTDQLLFPYRGDVNFAEEIKPFIRNPLTQGEIDDILAKYPQNEVSHVTNVKVPEVPGVSASSSAPFVSQENSVQPIQVISQPSQPFALHTKIGIAVVLVTLLDILILCVALIYKFIRRMMAKEKRVPFDTRQS